MRALLAKRCKQRVDLAPVGAPPSLPCIPRATLPALFLAHQFLYQALPVSASSGAAPESVTAH